MLVIMAVMAVGIGILANRARVRRHGLDLIRQHGGTYHFDFEYGDDAFVPNPASWAPRWLRRLVGDENLHDLTYVQIQSSSFSDDELIFLTSAFPRIKSLGINNSSITDRGLSALRGNRDLCGLFVKNRGITDLGIDRLDPGTLPKLSLIDVRGTRVTPMKLDELKSILAAREQKLKRENPGKRVHAHFVLE